MPLATSFARYACSLDASEGVVLGVYGPWGSGKTSFLNLTECAFEEIGVDVLRFDPWHFSGTGQLLNRFFEEISTKSSKLNFSKHFPKHLATYVELIGIASIVAPEVSVVLPISRFVSSMFQCANPPQSLKEVRDEIEGELRNRELPIVIMIDEVDRLTKEEVLEVFKLVRLIGRFPQLIYIVACDREQVEKALDRNQDYHSGRRYMEKIIQYPVNLPHIADHRLIQLLDKGPKDILDSANLDRVIKNDRWPDIKSTIVAPLLKNLRDVNRFLTVVSAAVDDLESLVTPVDVIALEAVRMFLPDTFIILPTIINVITVDRLEQESLRKAHEALDPHKDSYQSGWNQHKDLELQRAKADRMLKYPDQGDSSAEDIEQSSHVEYMVRSSLVENVFPPTRMAIEGKADEHYVDDLIDDWERVFIKHVFESYLARKVGQDLGK